MESQYISLVPTGSAESYHFSQNDDNRTIRCIVYDGAIAVSLTGKSVRLRYRKPDDTISSIGAKSISGNCAEFDIPQDVTDISGEVYCKLRIDGIGSKAFYIKVEEGV